MARARKAPAGGSATRTFRSVGFWTHGGTRYAPGQTLELAMGEARLYLERGTIVPVPAESERATAEPVSEARSKTAPDVESEGDGEKRQQSGAADGDGEADTSDGESAGDNE